MVSVLRRFALATGFALLAGPLHALMLTVSGVTYDITLNLGSFTTVDTGPNGPLTTTPWFGSAFLDNALADELRDQNDAASGLLVPDPDAVYLFANRSLSTGFITSSAYDPMLNLSTSETSSFTTSVTREFTVTGAPIYFASGSVFVPPRPGNQRQRAGQGTFLPLRARSLAVCEARAGREGTRALISVQPV